MEITDTDAKKLWMKAINVILKEGDEYIDNDGKNCREIKNLILNLKNVNRRNIENPINHINSFDFILYPSKEELVGVMFKKMQAPIYEYTYGDRIFSFSGIKNQIDDFVIPLLKKDPSSRRGVISIYDPAKDSYIENHNTPCLMYIQVRIIDNKLALSSAIRSNDVLFGLPANLFQLFSIQEYVCKELNLEFGEITILCNSGHIFVDENNDLLKSLKE
jgi:thymidylate synthase